MLLNTASFENTSNFIPQGNEIHINDEMEGQNFHKGEEVINDASTNNEPLTTGKKMYTNEDL